MSANSPLAPGLSWLHLAASETTWDAADAPGWMRALLAAGTSSSGKIFEGRRLNATDLAAWQTVVAVDCRGMKKALADSGRFAYIRRFAVIPNLQQARWFIPLDSGAIASAAFCLYTPARLSAKVKKFAARAAVYAHLPLPIGQRLIIASQSPPPLEKSLAGLYPNQTIRLAISSGAPEPARNRKVSMAILGDGGSILGFAKLAASPIARQLLSHEAAALGAMSLRADELHVPQLMFSGEVDGYFLTVQSPLAGGATSPGFSTLHREFLLSLQSSRMAPATQSDTVQRILSQANAIAAICPAWKEALSAVLPQLGDLVIPLTLVHGDFAPWNLRQHGGKLGAFDWEYADINGLPLYDQTHFLLQVGTNLHQWPVDRACSELAQMTADYSSKFSQRDAGLLQILYLLDVLARLLSEGYLTADEMIGWHLSLLSRLVAGQRRLASA